MDNDIEIILNYYLKDMDISTIIRNLMKIGFSIYYSTILENEE